jgi:predicted ATPase with chaperone activity
VGILSALEVVSRPRLEDYLLLGELSPDGRVKSIRGALSLALAAKSNGFKITEVSELRPLFPQEFRIPRPQNLSRLKRRPQSDEKM